MSKGVIHHAFEFWSESKLQAISLKLGEDEFLPILLRKGALFRLREGSYICDKQAYGAASLVLCL